MEIIRVRRDENNPYVTINKAPLQDKNLSLEAKGLLTVILSLPPSWEFTVEGMATLNNCTNKAIYKIIKELVDNDYCLKRQLRKKQGFGKFEYVFSEIKLKSVHADLSKAQTWKAQMCLAQNGRQLSNKVIINNEIKNDEDVLEIIQHFQKKRLENFVDLEVYSSGEEQIIQDLKNKHGINQIKKAIDKAVKSELIQSWEYVYFNNIFKEENILKLLRGDYDVKKAPKNKNDIGLETAVIR